MNYRMNFRFKDERIQNEVESILAGIKVPSNRTFLVKSQDTQNAELFFRFHKTEVSRIPCTTQPVWCQKNPNHADSYSFYFIGQYDSYCSRTLGNSFVRQLYGSFLPREPMDVVNELITSPDMLRDELSNSLNLTIADVPMRVDPEALRNARERITEYIRNELGLQI